MTDSPDQSTTVDTDFFDGVDDEIPVTDGSGDDRPLSGANGSASGSGPETAPGDDPALDGTDHVDPRKWVGDLTYTEVHAFTLGVGPAAGIMLGAPQLWPSLIVMYAVALTTNAEQAVPFDIPIATKVRRQLVKEPWYFAGGTTAGWLGGALADLAGVV